MADLPSILGGMAQGFIDFGKGAVDLFGTGGAAIGDLVDTIRTGKVTTKNQDDFRKWLYQTDSTKDAAAKGLGTALNGVQTVLDYIPGVNVLTRNPLGNAAQGALGGLADEFKTYGEDYDLGRAGQRAAVSGAAAAASGSLADALKGSSNALLSSNTLQGLARGATGGAITGGGYAAIDGGDVLEAAKQGAGMGALIGGATGAFQDFKPAKTYDVALTDDERAARIANAQKQIDDIGPVRRFTDDPNELAKRARVNELQDAIKAYQSGYDTVQDYNDALAARRANRQPSLTREEYEAKMQQRIRDLGGNYEVTPEKQAQFDRLQKVNPMRDDYHTGIRAPQDIATLQEAINNAKDIDPAYKAMLQKALADDSVTVYSSYPIEEGVFTTPIKQMAQDYAGPGNQVYSKTISPNDIAWIDDQEGNYIPRLQQLETTLSDADMAVNNPRYLTDENGNPRTFYHGSPNKNITEFDINQAGKNTSSGEHALYFTDSPEVADEFSYERLPSDSMFVDNRGAKGRVYPVNLAMDNPLDLSNLSDKQIEELWQYASPLGKLDGKEKFIKNMKAFRDYGNDQLIKTNLDLDKLANSQYDGFTARMYPNQDNQAREYAVFDNSKVKMLEDVLANDDAAVNAAKLTPEQEAYFKDSVIRDENGNLMPLYHGSNSKFTVFDSSKGGQSNKTAKVGHWFTPSEEGAKNFANSVWYGDESEPTVYSTYLNVKNPKIYEAVDNSAQIKALNNEMDGLQRQLDGMRRGSDDFNATYKKYNDLAKQIENLSYGDPYEQFRSDIYAMEGKTPYQANVGGLGMMMDDENAATQKYVQSLRDQGYDGIIIRGTNYDNGTLGGVNDQYVVFDSNQIKSTNNLRPTENPDIRYSKASPGKSLEKTLASSDAEINRVGSDNVAPVDPTTLPDSLKAVQDYLDEGNYIKDIENFAGKPYPKLTNQDYLDYAISLKNPKDKAFYESIIKDMVDDGTTTYEKYAASAARNNRLNKLRMGSYNDIDPKALASYVANHRQALSNGAIRDVDAELSDRLGIGRSNTLMMDNNLPPDALGVYDPTKTALSIDTRVPEENAINTLAHERLHSFQTEGDFKRYDKRVTDAYEELSKDLNKYLKTPEETAKRYAFDTDYWGNEREQQSRMLQQYLENKGFTRGGLQKSNAGEWGNEINPAFDKFFDKLRDLSKRGVALPALAALFGGGAYMASQENDKEKEVK